MNDTTEAGTALATTKPQNKTPAKVSADNSGILAIIPRDLEEAWRYCSALIRGGAVPDSFRAGGKAGGEINPSLVVSAVMRSMEIGMAPQTGLSVLYPIRGKLTIYGDGAQGLVSKSGQLVDQKVETIGPSFDKATTDIKKWPSGYGYRVSLWRAGVVTPFVAEFTVRDATLAGLWGKFGPWQLYPDRMLFNRARAFAQRDGFADALLGLGIWEEMIDTVPERKQLADNSALDDDLTDQDIAISDPLKLPGLIDEYIGGLARQVSLDGLVEYQQQDANVRLLQKVSESDEEAYARAITAGAARYGELEAVEEAARKAQEEATQEAEIEEIEVADNAQQGDLLSEGE